jgi:phosphoglycolate phosphatase
MGEYEYILFDLDGTLAQSLKGVGNSIIYALKHFSIDAGGYQSLGKCVGPPLEYSFQSFFGLSEEDTKIAISKYREYYNEKGISECEPYDGIKNCVRRLYESGRKLVLATSKPEIYASKIIRSFGLSDCFIFEAGATLDGSRVQKEDVIRHALRETGITPEDRAVMIGDRHHDITGAAGNGLDAIGVTWGYGRTDEFDGAVFVADTPEALLEYLL